MYFILFIFYLNFNKKKFVSNKNESYIYNAHKQFQNEYFI